jgi:hypothetical protein
MARSCPYRLVDCIAYPRLARSRCQGVLNSTPKQYRKRLMPASTCRLALMTTVKAEDQKQISKLLVFWEHEHSFFDP